jgi:acetyl-CoA carboxylase carboxyltransferase component
LQEEYREDIDLMRLASDLHVDAVVAGHLLRGELIRRFAFAENKVTTGYSKRRSVLPV